MSEAAIANFSDEAWREYCLDRVRDLNTPEKTARFQRLIGNNISVMRAWRNLAEDRKPLMFTNEAGVEYLISWQESLHQVIGTLIFPPSVITPTPAAKYKKALTAAKALKNALDGLLLVDPIKGTTVAHNSHPILDEIIFSLQAEICGVTPTALIPGKMRGKNAERNWLALYLRTWIIGPFFMSPHHEDVATLVNAALDIDSLSADDVRLMKPRSRSHP